LKKKMEKATEAKKAKDALTAEEVKKLAECEEAIQENSKMYFLAGESLTQINEERLYKADFTDFDKYCEGRWGFSGSHARRLMDSYELVKKLRSGIPHLGDDELPQNEFQARLYMDLREEKHWVRSWKTLLKAAKEKEVVITATLIRAVCGKADEDGGCKKPHPKAKAKIMDSSEPQLEYVNTALGLVEDARSDAENYSLRDWNKFLDEIEVTLERIC